MLMAGRRQADYERLLQGEGVLKTLFKAVKGSLRGQDRVFITGVSPVVLSDMTSGYNVGEDIYLDETFNDLCGFTEAEITQALEQLATKVQDKDWSTAEALGLMRTFYNGYRFATRARERLYNPTLSLYFLKNLQTEGRYPDEMLDENMAMDRGKLQYIAELPHGEDLVAQALDGETGIVIAQLAKRFGVADVVMAAKDQPFMASLLYYFGVLTLTGRTDFLEAVLNIPNLVARSLYVERLQERWLTTYEDRNSLPQWRKQVFQTGDLTSLVAFIETRYFPILSNRDYRWSNELMVKLAFLTLLFDDRLYMMVSETEMDHGYVDLSLIRRFDRREIRALDLLLEFKYVSLQQIKLTGEQLRQKPMAELAALPTVAAELEAAGEQARRYGGALSERYGLSDLRLLAVVGVGLERVVWQPVALGGTS
ncbi:AAA family ATPase [Lamprobacter modestohalophilus]|uniref:AAA family ATPase n=1 Tax=Lamprobacter modestohalophilus TaxID=1064514 RepID=UPI002ADEC124|nr:AAA family ATPase [Lamprobacter modestohalophilus]MEA1050521.1 AAA family ATPase [Lamprobacter modestohalophilus]